MPGIDYWQARSVEGRGGSGGEGEAMCGGNRRDVAIRRGDGLACRTCVGVQGGLYPWCYIRSNRSQTIHCVRKLFDQANEQRSLRVWPRTPLFPVLQRTWIGSQVAGKHLA